MLTCYKCKHFERIIYLDFLNGYVDTKEMKEIQEKGRLCKLGHKCNAFQSACGAFVKRG